MYAFFAILIIATAFVAPWATISAFEYGRLAGWMTTLVAVVCHVATWYIMAGNKEIMFCLSPSWGAYEFICLSFIPLGIGEAEYQKEQTAEASADKG